MHPRIAELIEELDDARAELHSVVSSLSEEDARRSEGPDGWTVAQILEHLSMVEDGTGRLLSGLVKEAAAAGAREESTSSVRGINDAYAIAKSDVRITAPEFIRPTAGLSVAESMDRLEAARARLKDLLQRASGLALETVQRPHPVFGPFNAYQWTLATAQHERRHIRQIRRILGGVAA